MTSHERAMVAAFLARRTHGDDSWQYASALQDLETSRPKLPTFCSHCGGRGLHRKNCPATTEPQP